MNFLKNEKQLILIHKDIEDNSSSNNIDIVLSPQFYTIKKVKKSDMPVKNKYQAKKVATSVFSGLLEENKEYSYFILDEDEYWSFIAYAIDDIIIFLNSKKFNLNNISKFYFIEQAKDKFNGTIKLTEVNSLTKLNDMIVVMPNEVFSFEESFIQFTNEFKGKKGISLNHGSDKDYLSETETLILSIVFIIISFISFYEGTLYSNNNIAIENKINLLLEEHPAYTSSYSRDSVLSKYRLIDKKEKIKRESLKNISGLISKNVSIKGLDINEKRIIASFTLNKSFNFSKFKKNAEYKGFKVMGNQDRVSIEVKI